MRRRAVTVDMMAGGDAMQDPICVKMGEPPK